jgi:hypothetical protein
MGHVHESVGAANFGKLDRLDTPVQVIGAVGWLAYSPSESCPGRRQHTGMNRQDEALQLAEEL